MDQPSLDAWPCRNERQEWYVLTIIRPSLECYYSRGVSRKIQWGVLILFTNTNIEFIHHING